MVSKLFVVVMYGWFTGCGGPIVGMMPDPDAPSYLYQIRMHCAGRHDGYYWKEAHDVPLDMLEYFPATYLKPEWECK